MTARSRLESSRIKEKCAVIDRAYMPAILGLELMQFRRLFWCGLLIASTLVIGGSRVCAFAQQAITSAAVSGVVQDETGANIPSASVRITNLDRNQSSKIQTDEEGKYRFSYLPPGAYEIQVEQPGFAVFHTKLTLFVGQALDVPVRLPIAGVAKEVTVTGDPPLIESA